MTDDDPRETLDPPPPTPDPREAEFRLAGGEFLRPGARDVWRRQLLDAERDGYARGHDSSHESCVRLVEAVRHDLNGHVQALRLELAELRRRVDDGCDCDDAGHAHG